VALLLGIALPALEALAGWWTRLYWIGPRGPCAALAALLLAGGLLGMAGPTAGQTVAPDEAGGQPAADAPIAGEESAVEHAENGAPPRSGSFFD
jgi:hypothetical protein